MKNKNNNPKGDSVPLDHSEFIKDSDIINAPLKILVDGIETFPQNVSNSNFDVIKTIEVGLSRASGNPPTEIDGEEIGELVFEDGTTWIGYVGDFEEIYRDSTKRSTLNSNVWVLPNVIQGDKRRNIIAKSVLKFFNIFRPKDNASMSVGKSLALSTDKKILTEGLYLVDNQFNLSPIGKNYRLEGKVLLLLHGTLSSTKGSFIGLKGDYWDKIYKEYKHVIALEHYTLSKTPIENALDLLTNLSPNVELDILSHSRGGLIGDVLSRFDIKNDKSSFGYSEQEIEIFGKEEPSLVEVIKKLQALAISKSLTIKNFVRVACPAGGTTLLGERLDHYLNAILNAIGLLFGGKGNFLYGIVKEFLLQIVHSRTHAESIPGLWAMVPNSAYQKINNIRDRDVKSKLFVIAGDSMVGENLVNTLLVILTNIYYLKANDFVVDTKSMKRGVSRSEGLYQYLSKDSKTSHFNYFSNENTQRYILMGLSGKITDGPFSFDYISKSNMDRGVDLTLKMLRYNFDNVSGKRPIAILLPGIMGSLLNDSNGNVWVNIPRFLKGDFVSRLNINANDVFADGVMAESYKKIGDFLLQENDLKVLAYDWRQSLQEVSNELIDILKKYLSYNQPITIIAHSMGGLVVKQLLAKDKKLWEKFCAGPKNNLILLGTPWLGSHLIMEVLTGHSKRIKQIDFLDWSNGKTEILKTIHGFAGVFELLPITNEGFEQQSFWQGFKKYVKDLVVPPQNILDKYNNYAHVSKEVNLGEMEKRKVFYIAGKGDTVNGYYIKKEFFRGEVLKYSATSAGDGSVTYELGIPKDLLKENLTYVDVSHGNLANEEEVFKEIQSIMKTGKLKSSSRSLAVNTASDFYPSFIINDKSEIVLAGEDEEVLDNIFDLREKVNDTEDLHQELVVSIVNADLKYANYPVMVGHFKNDGIYSAERSLDRYLNNKLSERHKLGFYPSDIGDSEIIFHKNSKPKGGLVVGLGKLEDLTPYLLSKSVESAVIKYAFFFRDNYEKDESQNFGRSISSVIIGNYYAGLSVEDSIGAILAGVIKANRKIQKLDIGLSTIQEIEFLDFYEDIAQQGYQVLKNIERNQNDTVFEVKRFRRGLGSKKRISAYKPSSWWHIFNATTIYSPEDSNKPLGLSYNSTSGKARVEQEVILADLTIMEHLSKTLSSQSIWRQDVSKSLFELLIPNDFKSILRNQKNILLKLDEYAAQFPWEMFHFFDEEVGNVDETPTFVNTGLIRQLIIDEYRVNPVVVDKDTALVVGDPDYSGSTIPQLPSAAAEAGLVGNILEDNKFETTVQIHKKPEDIIVNMFSKTYKIMHFAAHGVFEKVETKTGERIIAGIVLGDDIYLEPGTINQLSSIPEFIFINCCYSGMIGGQGIKYSQFKPELAANIGTQLIRMGVKAVVVAGWAVDDAAALTFSRELYNFLFKGYEFGIAVQKARKITYLEHAHTNTWGAYQCYGDYFYKLNNKNPDTGKEDVFVTSAQAAFELDNFLSTIRSSIVNANDQLNKFYTLKNRISGENLENADILERYAFIYTELGKFEEAKDVFEELFKLEGSKFLITSLEQYHSTSGKVNLEKYKILKSVSDQVDAIEIDKFRGHTKELIEEARIILKLGETSDRLSHIANMYKRASLLFDDKEERIFLLEEFKKQSYRAYEISIKTLPLEGQIFSLTNYLFALYALNGGNISIADLKINIGKYKSLESFLNYLIEQLDNMESTYSDYYQVNAKAKILSFLYLYDKKASKVLYDKFESAMLWSLEYYGNIKNVFGEVEQIEFLISIIDNNDKKAKLDELKAKLIALLI